MKEELFQAFSHPCRRQIIRMLRWRNMSAGEIAEQFDIAQPSVSRHLDVLKRAGAVTTEKRGTQVIYSLNMTALQEMLMYVTELLVGREAEELQGGDMV
ncbi:MAG: winged helix-turn-helix transcriptional regulator [Lachnospiraceae bacterium]|nr:winged helix-turn-helix transcriptional regulator [Lachnospiraceae bacterium]